MKFGGTAIVCAMLLSGIASAQEVSLIELRLMKEGLASLETDINSHDRASGWKYSMEADYALSVLGRMLQTLEEMERDPTKANLDKFREQKQRLDAAYNRFIDLVNGKPPIWRN